MRSRPIAVDLFAGAGGLSLGFEQAGFDIVAAVEIDPIHAAVHKLNFSETTVICKDIREVTGAEIRATAGLDGRDIDVVIGGPPCQGFSLIGYRSLNDPRNELVFHFLRLVSELRPRMFVFENVPGMATGAHATVLKELLQGFEDYGYRVRLPYQILNAANFGVPQDRRRLFLLGAREGEVVPEYPQKQTRKRGDESDTHLPVCPSVWDAIGDLPEIEEYDSLFETDVLRVTLVGGSAYARKLRGEIEDPDDYSYPRIYDQGLLTGCLRTRHTKESRERFAATPCGKTERVSRFFKLAEDGVCNTLRAGTASDRGAFSAPRPIHPRSPRCISVREAARLHSFPDWFRFHRTVWHGFRQIGNSVPPLLARAVGAAVREALGIMPQKPSRNIALGPESLAMFNMREAAAYFGVNAASLPSRRRAVAKMGS